MESKLDARAKQRIGDRLIYALTGRLGVMGKAYLASSFADEDDDSEASSNDEDCELVSLYCMVCTEAAQCGVSSKRCNQCFR